MASEAISFSARARRDGGAGRRYIATRAQFVPKKAVSVRVGSQGIDVYPILEPTAADSEKSHAFYVTSAALDVVGIQPKQRLSFLANQMGLQADLISMVTEMMRI